MKRAALVAAGAAAMVAVALTFGVRATGRANAGGFFGPGSLLADINLTLEVVLVLGLTIGAVLARRSRIEAHRVNQTVCVLVNAALVLGIMLPSLSNTKLARAADLARSATGLPWLHASSAR